MFPIAIENTEVFSKCCENSKLQHWLSGRTLLYMHKVGCFPNDKFDSVAVREESKDEIEKLINTLITNGFLIIKADKWNTLLNRNGRILEISHYVLDGKYLRHRNLLLNQSHFEKLKGVIAGDCPWSVPDKPDKLIHDIYTSSRKMLYFRTSPFLSASNIPGNEVARKIVNKAFNSSPLWLQNIFSHPGKKKTKRQILTEQELREIYFEEDLVNWELRKTHLDLITCNGKYRKVGEIIDYLNITDNLKAVRDEIIETTIIGPFLEPIYFNNNFWQSGNNHFINCILYAFRRGVAPYEEVNKYLAKNDTLKLFSAEYYQSLDPMDDKEIMSLLKANPIVIENNRLVGGRHRVCAMIGRLITGQSYLPVHTLKI